jgi:hypothetical protein
VLLLQQAAKELMRDNVQIFCPDFSRIYLLFSITELLLGLELPEFSEKIGDSHNLASFSASFVWL